MHKAVYGTFLSFLLSSNVLAKDIENVKVDVLAKTNKSWNDEKLPHYEKGEPEITILKIVIPPHVKLPMHKHPIINAGVLLKGELTVVTEDNKILHLKAGDAIVEVVNTWHYGKNEGDEPAELIMFYAGIKDIPLTILKKDEK